MVNRAAMKERFNPRFETTNDVLFSLTTFRLIEFKDYSEYTLLWLVLGRISGFTKCVVWVVKNVPRVFVDSFKDF